MNDSFLSRSACPACAAACPTIFSRPFAEPRLKAALIAFYARVGALDYGALEGADFTLAACSACGLVFQTNVPCDDLLGRLYEEWISPAQALARFHGDLPADHFLALAREVGLAAELARPGSPRRALDYGCGWGEWSQMTQAFGFEAWGTELSPTRRAHAERAGVRIAGDRDLAEGSFGLVNIDQVLEHLPRPGETIAMLAGKLHPAGVLRVAVPNGLRVRRALRHFDRELSEPRLGGLNPVAPLEHLNCFSTRSLLRLAAGCGLRRVQPPWRALLGTFALPRGTSAKLKAFARPFYLRSRFSTQLYFRKEPPGSAPSVRALPAAGGPSSPPLSATP